MSASQQAMLGVRETALPFPLVARGKVRDVYDVGDERLLFVATDRISAFDVVMREPIPQKGAVLTQITAWWLDRLAELGPHHLITADASEIADAVPGLRESIGEWAGRSMLVKRTKVIPVECVVRGYISGSAWKEYQQSGTLAGEPLPRGLREADMLVPPIFSPATKAETGHDENITFAQVETEIGTELARTLRDRSIALYEAGRAIAAEAGIIIADTKFEFGLLADGTLLLIDEVMTPDSSRFWPEETYTAGGTPPSLDKQPVRDYLEGLVRTGAWNREPPPPALTPDVIAATTERYREIFRRLTGDFPRFEAVALPEGTAGRE